MEEDLDLTMGELFRAYKEDKRKRRAANLKKANDAGWNKYTEFHWWRMLNGQRLQYWPSSGKFEYNGKYMNGRVEEFIQARLKEHQ